MFGTSNKKKLNLWWDPKKCSWHFQCILNQIKCTCTIMCSHIYSVLYIILALIYTYIYTLIWSYLPFYIEVHSFLITNNHVHLILTNIQIV